MKDQRTGTEQEQNEHARTKTPNKRAAAVQRRLAFLNSVYLIARDSWIKIPMKELCAVHRISNTLNFLYSKGIIEKMGRLYRWNGPAPTIEMVNDWSDYIMVYNRKRLNPFTTVNDEMQHTFDELCTADKRAQKILTALEGLYGSTCRGYGNRSLTTLCEKHGLPYGAVRHLISRGLIERPRHGKCKWVGPPPDRELALWLFGMLAEHHRTIYRSTMEKKQERTAMIDSMIGRTDPTFQGTDDPLLTDSPSAEVLPSRSVEYWSSPSTTWNANSTGNSPSTYLPIHLTRRKGLNNAQIKAPNKGAE